MIIDKIENAYLYIGLNKYLDMALEAILDGKVFDEPTGVVELPGVAKEKVFFKISEYDTREANYSGGWECHRKYVDIQVICRGCEWIGFANRNDLQEYTSYNSDKDCQFFSGKGTMIPVPEQWFMILFPQDCHLACVSPPGGVTSVRKALGKVLLEEEVNL